MSYPNQVFNNIDVDIDSVNGIILAIYLALYT